jgi:phosphate transport system substrate-binding protein
MKTFHGILAAVLALTTTGFICPGSARAEGLALAGAGATFPAPLYERWIQAYHDRHPDITIRYDRIGSGEGLARFIEGSVDFGASDTPPGANDLARAKSGAVLVPATAGMVVLAYNLPGLAGDLRLPADVYAGIFAGTITQWDDPSIRAANPGIALPHRSIAVVVRQDSSGTTDAFTRHLKAASPLWAAHGLATGKLIAWPAAMMRARGNEGVAARIRISEGSIGYVEYGFAARLGLPVASLRNADGQYVRPGPETGAQALNGGGEGGDPLRAIDNPPGANAYPIVTYSWLLLKRDYADPARSAAIRDFVRYGLAEGQPDAAALGYIPLPDGVAHRAEATLVEVK